MNGNKKGFTLIELILTIAISGIMLSIGIPNLSTFLHDNRVKSRTMDIYTDIMYAKSIAINRSQRVFMEKNTGTYGDWRDGWHIYGCADVNSSTLSSCTNKSTDYKKVMPSDANTKVCSAGGTAMPSSIVFRPDGRVITPTGFTGITVSDNRNTVSTNDDLIRTLLINFAGRVSIINQNGGTNSGVSC